MKSAHRFSTHYPEKMHLIFFACLRRAKSRSGDDHINRGTSRRTGPATDHVTHSPLQQGSSFSFTRTCCTAATDLVQAIKATITPQSRVNNLKHFDDAAEKFARELALGFVLLQPSFDLRPYENKCGQNYWSVNV
jgi:hypothetical protein